MIKNWLTRLPLIATFLVCSLAEAGVAPNPPVRIYYVANGIRYTCSTTRNPSIYECTAPDGKVVLINVEQVKVTGDTAQGCRKIPPYLLAIRTPETLCYEDVNADPNESLQRVADLLSPEEYELWLSQEYGSPEFLGEDPSTLGELPEAIEVGEVQVRAVPCEDGEKEGEIEWSDLIDELK